MAEDTQLLLIFCGPMIRKLTPGEMVLWWVSPKPLTGQFESFLEDSDRPVFSCAFGGENTQVVKIAQRAWVHLLTVGLPRIYNRKRTPFYNPILTHLD